MAVVAELFLLSTVSEKQEGEKGVLPSVMEAVNKRISAKMIPNNLGETTVDRYGMEVRCYLTKSA